MSIAADASKREMRAAFTLIELLIVVSIVAVLVAIMLPSLARAHEQAKAIKCVSNLSDISKGMLYYTMDAKNGNGYLPQLGFRADIGYWASQIHPYMKIRRTRVGARNGLLVCPADPEPNYRYITTSNERAWAGGIATAQDKMRSDQGIAVGQTTGRQRGGVAAPTPPRKLGPLIEPVSYTGMCETAEMRGSTGHHGSPAKWTEIRRPHCYVLLTEVSERFCMRWPDFEGGQYNYPSLTRHYGGSRLTSNGSNFLFADGHARWNSARFATTDMVCCVDLGTEGLAAIASSISHQRNNCGDAYSRRRR